MAPAQRTDGEVQAFADAAQQIGDVVKLINGIAGQTNLRALNATIEAAWGSGQGFRGRGVRSREPRHPDRESDRARPGMVIEIQGIAVIPD